MVTWKEIDGHQIYSDDVPPVPEHKEKWSWLRQAVFNSPIGVWMSTILDNKTEARRAQSCINNKYVKQPLFKRELYIRTRIAPASNPGGSWKIHWIVRPVKSA